LWVKRGVRLLPFITGGRQERNRRAGTENVPGLIGFGVAAAVARRKIDTEGPRLAALRDRLEAGVLSTIPGTDRNGVAEPRVPNTTNISIDRVEAESLLIGLDLAGIAVSSGSACSSGTLEPSHVLKAMGYPHARTLGSIRFSLGASNTETDVDRVLEALPPIVEKLRSLTTVGSKR
jgi:cysteine desulfurase